VEFETAQPFSARGKSISVPSPHVAPLQGSTVSSGVTSVRSSRHMMLGAGVVLALAFLGSFQNVLQPSAPHQPVVVPTLQQKQQAVSAKSVSRADVVPGQVRTSRRAIAANRATWEATISQWEKQHADFLSEPIRRQAMASALEAIKAKSGHTLEYADLIETAYRRAARATGWLTVISSTPHQEPSGTTTVAKKCIYKTIMTDDDLRICGITLPNSH
jgi:hypothetical protein